MKEKYELILCEKPTAALKIAQALADEKIEKENYKKVPYFKISHNKKNIYIASAVGHLYNLAEKTKKGWVYPTFNIEWKPAFEISKNSKFTKDYLDLIKKLTKDANEFTIATDLDNEGELIGYNVLRFICGKQDANRMEFSTLTKEDLIKSYENKKKHINKELALAGETRHFLDHYYGINLSRALTLSIKNSTGRFKILSAGRVQCPTLKILEEKEQEIKKFIPQKYWQIEVNGKVQNGELTVWHKEDKFWKKEQADSILKNIKGKTGKISEIKTKEQKVEPPTPFDLTTLQVESSSALGLPPKRTLEIAQELYTGGFISYPRTSSQKLPEAINYKKIINSLKQLFPKEVDILLKKLKLKPNEGKKTDPAHPAIYPTGELPKKLEEKSKQLYELITRRFLAVFGDPAIQEATNVIVDINKELFTTRGLTTKEHGWFKLYEKFVKSEDRELPKLKEGEKFEAKQINLHEKETQPQKRYSEASLVKELEKRGLGTKSTRAIIIDNLFQRNYVTDKSIKVTVLGEKIVETLDKYVPEILSEDMTKKFEEEMEGIIEDKTDPEEIKKEAITVLTKTLINFKKHEKEIGKELSSANQETQDKINYIGKCPICKQGTLSIKFGKFGPFISCDKYKEGCKTTFALPKGALTKGTGKECECKYPIILVIRKGKKPQEVCLNINCPKKEVLIPTGEKCPKCNRELIVRKSIYGSFLCCPDYPKCRYIKINRKKEEN
jgi:DNA topoisomerase-1